jgi:hypothetical protein
MLPRPEPVDAQVAAATFSAHLDELWEPGGIAHTHGWARFDVDPLSTIVTMRAERADGTKEHYFVRLGAVYYDAWPPTVAFVEPDKWMQGHVASRWWPQITLPPWLGMHLHHELGGRPGQLVCFTFTAEYYMTGHSPNAEAVWKQGVHTVAATLARLQEALRQPYYQKPSA